MGIAAPLGVSASGKPPAGDFANAVLSGQFTGVGPSAPFAFRGPMNVAIFASLVDALTVTAGSLDASVASGTGLAAGDAINSALVPRGTTVGAIEATAVTLAVPPLSLVGNPHTPNGQISDLALTAGLVGATVSGPNIPAGDTVTGIVQAAVPGSHVFQKGIVQLAAAPIGNPTDKNSVPFTFHPTGNIIQVSGTDATASFTGAAINYVGSVQLERSFDGGATWSVCNAGGSGTLAQYSAGTPVSFSFGEPEKFVYYRLNCTAYTSGVINYRISTTGGAAEALSVPLLT